MANRPLGVTIICILGWIGAILMIIGGLTLAGLGAFGTALLGGTGLESLGAFVSVVGYVFLILGIVELVVLYWLWKMQKKGWMWTMILEVIGIVLSIVQVIYNPMSFLGLIIPAIIVIYLWMKKDLFK